MCPKVANTTTLFPKQVERTTVIFAGANFRAQDSILDSVHLSHRVVLISTSNVGMEFWTAFHNRKSTELEMLDATTACHEQTLKNIFTRHDVIVTHVIFDDSDFHTYVSSISIGKLLHCLIKFLNVFSQYSKSVPLYLHLPISSQISKQRHKGSFLKYSQENEDLDETDPVFLQHLMDDIGCKIRFDYKVYTDSYLKAVQIYVMTFKRLYNLSVQTVLS